MLLQYDNFSWDDVNTQWGLTNSYYYYYSSLVGLDEDFINSLKVYPNPTNNILSFELKSTENASVEIVDIQGKPMLFKSFDNTITIGTTSWAKGIYIYTILQGKNRATGKIIVQ